jgi:hypothetical protein
MEECFGLIIPVSVLSRNLAGGKPRTNSEGLGGLPAEVLRPVLAEYEAALNSGIQWGLYRDCNFSQ